MATTVYPYVQYSGMWTKQAQMQAIAAGTWPTTPGAPTTCIATAGIASASIIFTAPVNTGSSAITSYKATSTPGGFAGTSATSPITVSGLSTGASYTFSVVAINAAGSGPATTTNAIIAL
jgi:hypothetical protein